VSRRTWPAVAVVLAGAVVSALPAAARVHDDYPNVDVFSVTLGRVTHSLAASPSLDSKPVASPNGKAVAFVSSRNGSPDIYVTGPGGANVHRVTTSPFTVGGGTPQMVNWGDFDAGETSIAWSPNSKQLAFTAVNARLDPSCFAHCYEGSLFVVNADGTGLRQLDTGVQSPVWSPNGKLIGYEGDMSPYGDVGAYSVAQANGRGKVKLTAGVEQQLTREPARSSMDSRLVGVERPGRLLRALAAAVGRLRLAPRLDGPDAAPAVEQQPPAVA
jgi:Tol biopolymer transport system component